MDKLKKLISEVIDKLPINSQQKNDTIEEIDHIFNTFNNSEKVNVKKTKSPKFIAIAVTLFLLIASIMWGWSLFIAMQQSNRPLQVTLKEKIEVPKEFYKGEKLITGDLDGDGSLEVIGLDFSNLFILNTVQDGYQLRWQGIPLEYGSKINIWGAEVVDINNDGKDEIIMGIKVPQIRKDYYLLQIFSWKEDSLTLIDEKELAGPQNSIFVEKNKYKNIIYLLGNSKGNNEVRVQKWVWENELILSETSVSFPKNSKIINIGKYANNKPELLLAQSTDLHFIYPKTLDFYKTDQVIDAKQISWEDINQDGLQELVLLTQGKIQVLTWEDNWEILFEFETNAESFWIADLNNDGKQEFILKDNKLVIYYLDSNLSTILDLPKGFKGIIDGTQGQLLYGADSDGVYIYKLEENDFKIVWQGLNFSQTKFANCIDLDEDGTFEYLTTRGDVFKKRNGNYRFTYRLDGFENYKYQRDLDQDGIEEFIKTKDNNITVLQWKQNQMNELVTQNISGEILDITLANIDLQSDTEIIVAVKSEGKIILHAFKYNTKTLKKLWELDTELSPEDLVWFGYIEENRDKGKIIVSMKSKDIITNKVLEIKNGRILSEVDLSEKVVLPEIPVIGNFRKNKIFMVGKKKLTMDPVVSFLSVENKENIRTMDQVLLEIGGSISGINAIDVDRDGALEVIISSASNDILIYEEE